MPSTLANNIDEVISILEEIIIHSKENNNPLGYFAALYKNVTVKVKEGIENNFFDDNERMEQLDVTFANKYLENYFAFQDNKTVSASWDIAFQQSKKYWFTVLQHLLVSMNAHINLDLGVAAAEISKNKNIDDLENDFNKINEILSSLVGKVEQDLSNIWPKLKWILKKTKKVDDFLIDFSMKMARDGAWKFATKLHSFSEEEFQHQIKERDKKIRKTATLITDQGIIVKIIFGIIRLGEKGSVSQKIEELDF